jgi:Tfp pilus assembly PilM family ATPase
MAKQRDTITGLTFAPDAVCLAQMVPDNQLIANIGIQPVDERVGSLWDYSVPSLKQLVRAIKLNGENVICSMPGEFAVIRKLSLDADETNIEETLEWEFSQHVIGAREEFVIDYEKLAAVSGTGLEQYLVVGYRKEIVEKAARLMRTNKLNPMVIDLDVFALINVYEANYGEFAGQPALCVLSDDTMTKCVLTSGGTFLDIEVLPHNDEAHSSSGFSAMIENAAARIIACNREPVVREKLPVMLSGSLFTNLEFADEVIKTVRNADILYPFRTIKCGTGMSEEQLKKYSPQLAVAVGLALRGVELNTP